MTGSSALLGSALGACMAALAYGGFRRTLGGSPQAFLMAFGGIFALQGLGFLGLGALCFFKGMAPLPLLAPYALLTVGGTLATALLLKTGRT